MMLSAHLLFCWGRGGGRCGVLLAGLNGQPGWGKSTHMRQQRERERARANMGIEMFHVGSVFSRCCDEETMLLITSSDATSTVVRSMVNLHV